VFNYVAQGLFERHKLIVSTQLCMAVLRARGELQRAKFDVLLRGPKVKVVWLGNQMVGDRVVGGWAHDIHSTARCGPSRICTTRPPPLCPSRTAPQVMGVDNPLSDWVPESVWGSVQALRELEDYANLPDDLVGSSKRWREWMELERPGGWRLGMTSGGGRGGGPTTPTEDEPLPGDWKRMPEFERLLLFRALRPDRLTAAMKKFVTNVIGSK